MARKAKPIPVEYGEAHHLAVASVLLSHFGFHNLADEVENVVSALGGDPEEGIDDELYHEQDRFERVDDYGWPPK